MTVPGDRLQAFREQLFDSSITQTYGNTGFENPHTGVDIVLANYPDKNTLPKDRSQTILAPVSGYAQVKDTGNRGFGKHVIIHQANDYAILVGHMKDFQQNNTRSGQPDDGGPRLQDGEFVYAGEQIGHMGNTGWSTGPHMHLGLYNRNGQHLDPTLGVPATAQPSAIDAEQTKRNVYYLINHDLGFGSGDNPGHLWTDSAPGPNQKIADVAYPFHRPDGSYDPNSEPQTEPSNNVVAQLSSYVSNQDINWTMVAGAVVAGLVGVTIIIVGLISLAREKPVKTITQPFTDTAKVAGKGAGKVAEGAELVSMVL